MQGFKSKIDGEFGLMIGGSNIRTRDTTITIFNPKEVMARLGHRRTTLVLHRNRPKHYKFCLIKQDAIRNTRQVVYRHNYRISGTAIHLPFCERGLQEIFGKMPEKIYVSW